MVRFTFTHPKQILEILRALCAGKTQPYDDLCRLFDQQTQGGADMGRIDDLLQRALISLQKTFTRRAGSLLQAGRDAVLPARSQQVTADTEFELITWLVISHSLGDKC